MIASLQISQYLSTYRLKYYFAVDHTYVAKKLGLLLFPFAHGVSHCQCFTMPSFYNKGQLCFVILYLSICLVFRIGLRNTVTLPMSRCLPVLMSMLPTCEFVFYLLFLLLHDGLTFGVPFRYIPLMAFLTYVLVAGFVIGTQGRYAVKSEHLRTNCAMEIILQIQSRRVGSSDEQCAGVVDCGECHCANEQISAQCVASTKFLAHARVQQLQVCGVSHSKMF